MALPSIPDRILELGPPALSVRPADALNTLYSLGQQARPPRAARVLALQRAWSLGQREHYAETR
jgi:hypothetical protein